MTTRPGVTLSNNTEANEGRGSVLPPVPNCLRKRVAGDSENVYSRSRFITAALDRLRN